MTINQNSRDFASDKPSRDFAPPAPGAVLRERVFTQFAVTQEDLAKAVGVSRFTISQILNGHRAITPEVALRLGRVLDTSPEVWLQLQAQFDLFNVRKRLGDELEKLPQIAHRVRKTRR